MKEGTEEQTPKKQRGGIWKKRNKCPMIKEKPKREDLCSTYTGRFKCGLCVQTFTGMQWSPNNVIPFSVGLQLRRVGRPIQPQQILYISSSCLNFIKLRIHELKPTHDEFRLTRVRLELPNFYWVSQNPQTKPHTNSFRKKKKNLAHNMFYKNFC